jgi:6-bladed beta-propeller
MRVFRFLLPGALFCCTAVLAAPGARVVQNVGNGMWDAKARKELHFEKDLSIGVEKGDDRRTFGRIADIGVDSRGLVYVADADQNRVQVFDGTGAFVRTIGREGGGPGEFRRPDALAIGNADTLYVASGGHISLFDANGAFVRSFTEITHGHVRSMKVSLEGDVFVVSFYEPTRKVIHKYHAGRHVLSFCQALDETAGIDRFDIITYAGGYIDLGPDGTIYYTQMTPYEIREFSSEGELTLRIFRENDFLKAPRIERDAKGVHLYPFAGACGIFLFPDGRLLNVISTPSDQANKPGGGVLDLFDGNGRLLTSQRLDWNFFPRCMDAQGRLWTADYRLFPAVARYRVTLR